MQRTTLYQSLIENLTNQNEDLIGGDDKHDFAFGDFHMGCNGQRHCCGDYQSKIPLPTYTNCRQVPICSLFFS
jgi:hypothetical protein